MGKTITLCILILTLRNIVANVMIFPFPVTIRGG